MEASDTSTFYVVEDRIPRVYPWMNEPSSSLRQQR